MWFLLMMLLFCLEIRRIKRKGRIYSSLDHEDENGDDDCDYGYSSHELGNCGYKLNITCL